VEQLAFEQKYSNLMEKHSKKSWLPKSNAENCEHVTKKPQEIVTGGRT
jgi:hypothetical protein